MALGKNVVVTGKVRLSFVNLFEAKSMREGDTPKYSVTCIIPKSDTTTVNAIKSAIQAAAEAGAQKHFGGRVPTNVNNTLKDGDTWTDDMGDLKKEKYPEYANSYVIRVSTKNKPKILAQDGQELLDATEAYSGVYGRVSMSFFAYSGDGNRGVTAGLNNVMIFVGEGEPLGGTRLTGSEFND